jgi:translation initiation factor IF-1
MIKKKSCLNKETLVNGVISETMDKRNLNKNTIKLFNTKKLLLHICCKMNRKKLKYKENNLLFILTNVLKRLEELEEMMENYSLITLFR